MAHTTSLLRSSRVRKLVEHAGLPDELVPRLAADINPRPVAKQLKYVKLLIQKRRHAPLPRYGHLIVAGQVICLAYDDVVQQVARPVYA